MSLSRFNDAASSTSYLKFDELAPGTYPIKRFSIMKKSSFGGKRLLVHLEEGFLIMPTRISDEFASPSEVLKLNEGSYNFIYIGKDSNRQNRLNFRLEMTSVTDEQKEPTMENTQAEMKSNSVTKEHPETTSEDVEAQPAAKKSKNGNQ